MISNALVAWLHFAAIFAALSALTMEMVLYRESIDVPAARRVQRADQIYGLAAFAILATGIARVLWFGKGWEFYAGNPVFWAKVGTFALIAVLSIPPTVHYIRWRRVLASGQAPVVPQIQYRRIRRLLHAQAALFLVVPLLASLMARGIGL